MINDKNNNDWDINGLNISFDNKMVDKETLLVFEAIIISDYIIFSVLV